MRVLMVHDEPIDGGYGAEAYVRRLADGLRATGDEVEVFAGEVRHIGAARLLDAWDPLARRSLSRFVERTQPDVINHHNVLRELSPSVLTVARGTPAVMTVHDLRLLGASEHRSSLRALGERAISGSARTIVRRRCRAVVGVSAVVTEALRQNGFTAASTVGVPVGEPAQPARPLKECRDVAVVARLAPDKGVDVVLDAFAAIATRVPGSVLHIAGDGPLRASLQDRARPLGDRVRFHGRLDERGVSALLGSVAVVTVASLPDRRPEGSSMTMAEAAAHGRPVVASDDPALTDLSSELGGVLVTPAGDAAALGDALLALLEDDQRRQSLGDANLASVKSGHSIAVVTEAMRRVYAEAVA